MENLFHRSSFEIDGFIYRFIGRFCYYYCERGKKREMFDLDPFTRDTNRARRWRKRERTVTVFWSISRRKRCQKRCRKRITVHCCRLVFMVSIVHGWLFVPRQKGHDWKSKSGESETGKNRTKRGRVNIRELTGKCNSCIAVSVIDVLQRKPVPCTLCCCLLSLQRYHHYDSLRLSLFSFVITSL